MSKIIRNKKYPNIVHCLCDNERDYIEFAKQLWNFSGVFDHYDFEIDYSVRWFDDVADWWDLFYCKSICEEDETYPNPLTDTDAYEIQNKPQKSEYPVIVTVGADCNAVSWVSLNELIG